MTRIRILFIAFQENVMTVPSRAIAFFAAVLFFLIPLFTHDPYTLTLLTYTNIFAILAACWDILGGYTRVISLAHGVLFGVAAYTCALINIHFGLQPWVTIPIGAVIAALTGLVIAIPALRVRGMYFTLISLAIPYIVMGLVLAFPDFTGGELGLSGVSSLAGSKLNAYYITLVAMVICSLIMWKLTDAKSAIVRIGVVLQAIREDEIAARAVGVNTIRYKLIAFFFSAFFAGIAGGLYVHTIHVAGPSTLELLFAFNPLLWTLFGGASTILGPIVGTYILYPFTEILRMAPQVRMLVFACLIILIIYFMPEGLLNWFRDKLEVTCPRCKLTNAAWRNKCRACNATLHLIREPQ